MMKKRAIIVDELDEKMAKKMNDEIAQRISHPQISQQQPRLRLEDGNDKVEIER